MRPSLVRVRCWFSSTDFERVSTFSFTSPTCCRTCFLVAHAVVVPIANAEIANADTNLFIALSLLIGLRTGARSGGVSAAGTHGQIPVPGLHVQRAPARSR